MMTENMVITEIVILDCWKKGQPQNALSNSWVESYEITNIWFLKSNSTVILYGSN